LLLLRKSASSAGNNKNFPQTTQIFAEFIHKIILSIYLSMVASIALFWFLHELFTATENLIVKRQTKGGI
jgi:hypothetical protein